MDKLHAGVGEVAEGAAEEAAAAELEDAGVGAEDGGETEVDEGEAEAEGADGAEGDETDEEEGGEVQGNRAQKRIQKLVGRAKDAERRVAELEQELEDAKKLGGEDGQIYLESAKRAGVLPSMMTKELAEGLELLDKKQSALEFYSEWLDGDEDELTLGDRTYSRRQVERQEQKIRAEIGELRSRFGGKREELQATVKAIFELGLKAKKAGWTGTAKKAPATVKGLNKPSAATPAAKRDDMDDFGEVSDEDSLEEAIMAQRRKRK